MGKQEEKKLDRYFAVVTKETTEYLPPKKLRVEVPGLFGKVQTLEVDNPAYQEQEPTITGYWISFSGATGRDEFVPTKITRTERSVIGHYATPEEAYEAAQKYANKGWILEHVGMDFKVKPALQVLEAGEVHDEDWD